MDLQTQDGAGRSKIISRGFVAPKKTLVLNAKASGVKGASKLTIMALLEKTKSVPSTAQLKTEATKYGLKFTKSATKEEMIKAIRRKAL